MEVQLHRGGAFIRVPAVTRAQREVLCVIARLGCDAFEGCCEELGRERVRVLRRLLGLGLIEVMGVMPARYRVTRLGRYVLGLRRAVR